MGKVIIVGDFFPVKNNINLFTSGDADSLFGKKICELFHSADYRICNLEGVLTDDEERQEKTGPVLVAPTAAVKAYKALGVDYCLLANNHITDAGSSGVASTITLRFPRCRGEKGLSLQCLRDHVQQTYC